jgi:MazG family protein
MPASDSPAPRRAKPRRAARAASAKPAAKPAPAGGRDAVRQIRRLLDIMARLREPGRGCPWDLEQTIDSLKSNLIEEAYEALDAMEEGDRAHLAEELGDVLLQVVFQSQIAAEEGSFDFAAVAKGIADKLVRRHPHIFGNVKVSGTRDVLRNWEAIKQTEGKAPRKRVLDGIPRHAPPLHRALLLKKHAARVGFTWPSVDGALDKLAEEIAELRRAIRSRRRARILDELGDAFFSLVNVAGFLDCDPAAALEHANRKFIARFQAVEDEMAAKGRCLKDCSPAELDAAWHRAKRTVRR